MLVSVSGWSGPSLAFFSVRVSSWSLRASACRPRVVDVGQVVHARERVGVVGAELGLPQRQRLLVELEGLGVPAQACRSWWPGCPCSRAYRGGRGRAWPFAAQGLLVELEGLGVPAQVGVAVGQVVHAPRACRGGRGRAWLFERQGLLVKLEGRRLTAQVSVVCWPGCACSRACRGGRRRAWLSAVPGSPRGA